MAADPNTTRPLTDESWIYWQKLASDEHTRLLELLREVYRDGILPQVLKQQVWSAINVR